MDSEEDATLCTVCCSVYDDPRSLPCGHSFCSGCILKIADGRWSFSCPCCRKNVILGLDREKSLPKNYSLEDIIQGRQNISSTVCSDHKKSLDIFCDDCDSLICLKCWFHSHSEHTVREMDIVFQERKAGLQDYHGSLQPLHSQIIEEANKIGQIQQSIEEKTGATKKAINDTFRRWFDALKEQKQNCMKYVDQESEQRLKICDDYQKRLQTACMNIVRVQSEMDKTLSADEASVVQQYGSLSKSHGDVQQETMQVMETPFVPPDDMKIDILAPWIEEAIENINPIDGRQAMQDSSCEQSVHSIIEENEILKGELNRLQSELEGAAKEYQLRIQSITRIKKKTSEELKDQKKINEELSQKLEAQGTKYKTVLKKLKTIKSGQEQRRKQFNLIQQACTEIQKVEAIEAITIRESWEECGRRETQEETGLQLNNVHFATVVNAVVEKEKYHNVELYVQGEVDTEVRREPINREPDKCEGWIWCNWNEFPAPEKLFCPLRVKREQGYNPFTSHA